MPTTDHSNTPAPPIRLLSTDFDGTLYSEFGFPHVPPVLQEQITALQAEGAVWIINTGRDLSSLMETLARCRLKVKPDYIVVVEREIYIHRRSKYVEAENWNSDCRAAHQEIFNQITPKLPDLIAWVQDHFKAEIYQDAYSPFCLIAESNAEADGICASMAEFCRAIPNLTLVRNDVYARLSHESYNKGTAMKEIARWLQIPAASIVAAGDHYNDLPMLNSAYAGRLAAPENAISEVKELVRSQNGFVSTFSHGHGVADALNFYLGKTASRETAPLPPRMNWNREN